MRPLRLDVSAFGPFAGAESVDFEALGPEALFLIHGATGSGKSTLLDAMCFALYGQSLGGDRTGEQLRSDHADPAQFTQVQFDFAVGSRHYRVTRSPEQERLKKSGKGTTRSGPKATLLDADADFAPLADGKKKVDTAIAKVLGFACDDFRQVVMLPQGRFRPRPALSHAVAAPPWRKRSRVQVAQVLGNPESFFDQSIGAGARAFSIGTRKNSTAAD